MERVCVCVPQPEKMPGSKGQAVPGEFASVIQRVTHISLVVGRVEDHYTKCA